MRGGMSGKVSADACVLSCLMPHASRPGIAHHSRRYEPREKGKREMTKRIMFLAIAAAFSVSAFALSDEYAQFGKGPAQFLMTKDEQAQWRAVKTDDEAKKFIDDFWARRGAQAKAEFEAKVKYSDEHFAEPHKKGSMSDRGHVLIVLGGPAKRTQSQPQMNTPPRIDPNAANEDQAADQPRARQVWEYEQGKTPGLPMPVLDVAFVDTLNNGEWKLERTRASGDYNQVFDKFNEATVAAHSNAPAQTATTTRSEEHTSELQS